MVRLAPNANDSQVRGGSRHRNSSNNAGINATSMSASHSGEESADPFSFAVSSGTQSKSGSLFFGNEQQQQQPPSKAKAGAFTSADAFSDPWQAWPDSEENTNSAMPGASPLSRSRSANTTATQNSANAPWTMQPSVASTRRHRRSSSTGRPQQQQGPQQVPSVAQSSSIPTAASDGWDPDFAAWGGPGINSSNSIGKTNSSSSKQQKNKIVMPSENWGSSANQDDADDNWNLGIGLSQSEDPAAAAANPAEPEPGLSDSTSSDNDGGGENDKKRGFFRGFFGGGGRKKKNKQDREALIATPISPGVQEPMLGTSKSPIRVHDPDIAISDPFFDTTAAGLTKGDSASDPFFGSSMTVGTNAETPIHVDDPFSRHDASDPFFGGASTGQSDPFFGTGAAKSTGKSPTADETDPFFGPSTPVVGPVPVPRQATDPFFGPPSLKSGGSSEVHPPTEILGPPSMSNNGFFAAGLPSPEPRALPPTSNSNSHSDEEVVDKTLAARAALRNKSTIDRKVDGMEQLHHTSSEISAALGQVVPSESSGALSRGTKSKRHIRPPSPEHRPNPRLLQQHRAVAHSAHLAVESSTSHPPHSLGLDDGAGHIEDFRPSAKSPPTVTLPPSMVNKSVVIPPPSVVRQIMDAPTSPLSPLGIPPMEAPPPPPPPPPGPPPSRKSKGSSRSSRSKKPATKTAPDVGMLFVNEEPYQHASSISQSSSGSPRKNMYFNQQDLQTTEKPSSPVSDGTPNVEDSVLENYSSSSVNAGHRHRPTPESMVMHSEPDPDLDHIHLADEESSSSDDEDENGEYYEEDGVEGDATFEDGELSDSIIDEEKKLEDVSAYKSSSPIRPKKSPIQASQRSIFARSSAVPPSPEIYSGSSSSPMVSNRGILTSMSRPPPSTTLEVPSLDHSQDETYDVRNNSIDVSESTGLKAIQGSPARKRSLFNTARSGSIDRNSTNIGTASNSRSGKPSVDTSSMSTMKNMARNTTFVPSSVTVTPKMNERLKERQRKRDSAVDQHHSVLAERPSAEATNHHSVERTYQRALAVQEKPRTHLLRNSRATAAESPPIESPLQSQRDRSKFNQDRLRRFRGPSPPPSVHASAAEDNMESSTEEVLHRRRERFHDYMANSAVSADKSRTSSNTQDNSFQLHSPQSSAQQNGFETLRLQSIMRRSKWKKSQPRSSTRPLEPIVGAFDSYDEENVSDPMQIAGIRLLVSAVVPIQAAARRYLALREALARMWAIVIIQTFTRRWLVRSWYLGIHGAAAAIQSIYRGGRARDQLLLEHCCAIEIQRRVRGYLATLSVYETIYKITIVQSVVRRKQAINLATDRMVFIIQLQTLVRGYFVRRVYQGLNRAVLLIQSAWRGAYCRLSYQLDLLDIIIVQSVVRRKITLARIRRRAATVIQAHWRATYSRISYQLYILVVIDVQAAIRGFLIRRRLQHRAATIIQAGWRRYDMHDLYRQYLAARKIQARVRTFFASVQYQIDMFSIVTIQSLWRKRRAEKYVGLLLESRRHVAAMMIQEMWRSNFPIWKLIRNQAARTIQARWRAYDATMNYLHYLTDVIVVQGAIRRFLLKVKLARNLQRFTRGRLSRLRLRDQRAACTIQRFWRGFVCYADYMFTVADIVVTQAIARRWLAKFELIRLKKERKRSAEFVLFAFCKRIKYRKDLAAQEIQRRWRGSVVRTAYKQEVAAREIQRCWRGFVVCTAYRKEVAARKIQRGWRGFVADTAYRKEFAAREIQRSWRGFVVYTVSFIDKIERRAVIKIQSAWRRFLYNTNYVIKIDAAIRIQSAYRGYAKFRDFEEMVGAAIIIQNMIRICLAQLDVTNKAALDFVVQEAQTRRLTEMRAAVDIQALWHGFYTRKVLQENFAAVQVQTQWRMYTTRRAYVTFLAVLKIQSQWRMHSARQTYVAFLSALRIQSQWRMHSARQAYVAFLAALKIQSQWRMHSTRRAYVTFRAVLKIQVQWRMHYCRVRYVNYISARRIQKIWRGVYEREMYRPHFAARRIQARWRCYWLYSAYTFYKAARTIQKEWRGYSLRSAFACYRAAVIIQAAWRCKSMFGAYQLYVAARKIQTRWRWRLAQTKYGHLRQKFKEYCAIVVMQSAWRRKAARVKFVAYREKAMRSEISHVCQIQRAWRGFLVRDALLHETGLVLSHSIREHAKRRYSTLKIQTVWRRFVAVDAFTNYKSAVFIQKMWRRHMALEAYWDVLGSAIQLQALIRGWSWRTKLHKLHLAATSIQKLLRMKLGINELARRRFILTLVKQVGFDDKGKRIEGAKGKRSEGAKGKRIEAAKGKRIEAAKGKKTEAAKGKNIRNKRDDWLAVVSERNKIDRAARTIQRFFKMVKCEVDRVIRAEKERKRRKRRKSKKKKTNELEVDNLLENVWQTTLRNNISMDNGPKMRGKPMDGVDLNRTKFGSDRTRPRSTKKMGSNVLPLPSEYQEKSQSRRNDTIVISTRTFDDDNMSVNSYWSTTSSQLRVPRSRMALTPREIDDDLTLETAWLDTEIRQSKASVRAARKVAKPISSRASRATSVPNQRREPSPAANRRSHSRSRPQTRPPSRDRARSASVGRPTDSSSRSVRASSRSRRPSTGHDRRMTTGLPLSHR